MKKIWIITLFPEFFEAFSSCGVIGQALNNKRKTVLEYDLQVINLREFSCDNYKGVDDSPFGGGPGMVMKADVLFRALDHLRESRGFPKGDFSKFHVVYTAPRGVVWRRDHSFHFAKKHLETNTQDLVFICGRYEGVDERFLEKYVNEFISLGDYVLSGGEIAVQAILDSAFRFVDGVLGNKNSYGEDSFEEGLLEYPQYTRPREFQGMSVPEILLSGHHQKMIDFQKEKQQQMTEKYRPDLWEKYQKREKEKRKGKEKK